MTSGDGFASKGPDCPDCPSPTPATTLGPADGGNATLHVCGQCGNEFEVSTHE